ncbi:MAG: hypothetical protein ACW99U_21350 [Candidatus Thorarchaeota archaeon]
MQVFDFFVFGNSAGVIALFILAPLMLILVTIRYLAIRRYIMERKNETRYSILGKFGDRLANGTMLVFDLFFVLIAVLGIGGLVLFFLSFWVPYGFHLSSFYYLSAFYFLVFIGPLILSVFEFIAYIAYTRFTLVGKAWSRARFNIREFGKSDFNRISIGNVISGLVTDINKGSIEESKFAISQLEHLLNNKYRAGMISQEILRAVDNELWKEYSQAPSRTFRKSLAMLFAIASLIFILTLFMTYGFGLFFAVYSFFHASIFYYLEK